MECSSLRRLDFTGGNGENGGSCLFPLDILVYKCVIVDVKAVETVHPIHKDQLLSYMKLLDIPLGLIINFNVLKMTGSVSKTAFPD